MTEQTTKATSAAGWKKAATHTVRCPSGVYVGIRIPDLPALIESGSFPQHLLDAAGVAAKVADEPKDAAKLIEDMKHQREYTDLITKLSVVEPKLSDADIAEIPYEDKEFLVLIATRQRDFDAEYKHIGGLDSSESFRRFRKLGEFESDVEGAEVGG